MIASAPGYIWEIKEGQNGDAEQANLEMFTENMIEYLSTVSEVQTMMVTSGDNNVINEGEEDGSVIDVKVTNAIFASSLTQANWTIENLPAGVTATVGRFSDQHAILTLSGEAEDYDEDILNFTVAIPSSEFINLKTDSIKSVGDVVFKAFIEVEQSSGKIALLGTEANMADLDEDEQAAYNWALRTFPGDAYYLTFEQIVVEPSLLDSFNVIWWHYDKFIDLPLVAANPNTEKVMQDFWNAGKGVLLTGFATQYTVNIQAETAGPNEVAKADEPFVNPDHWGFLAKNHNHPVFLNIPNPFFTLYSPTGLREDSKAWWVINPDDPRFVDIPPEDRFHGDQLASTEWDASFNILVTFAEYKGNNDIGNLLAIGAGSYDWYLENGVNEDSATLQLLTSNCLDYLKKTSVGIFERKRELQTAVYPNPAVNQVQVSFELNNRENVSVDLLDLQGRQVARLYEGDINAGIYMRSFNLNEYNLKTGLYLISIRTDTSVGYSKLMINR
jgi:hypothetical protein